MFTAQGAQLPLRTKSAAKVLLFFDICKFCGIFLLHFFSPKLLHNSLAAASIILHSLHFLLHLADDPFDRTAVPTKSTVSILRYQRRKIFPLEQPTEITVLPFRFVA